MSRAQAYARYKELCRLAEPLLSSNPSYDLSYGKEEENARLRSELRTLARCRRGRESYRQRYVPIEEWDDGHQLQIDLLRNKEQEIANTLLLLENEEVAPVRVEEEEYQLFDEPEEEVMIDQEAIRCQVARTSYEENHCRVEPFPVSRPYQYSNLEKERVLVSLRSVNRDPECSQLRDDIRTYCHEEVIDDEALYAQYYREFRENNERLKTKFDEMLVTSGPKLKEVLKGTSKIKEMLTASAIDQIDQIPRPRLSKILERAELSMFMVVTYSWWIIATLIHLELVKLFYLDVEYLRKTLDLIALLISVPATIVVDVRLYVNSRKALFNECSSMYSKIEAKKLSSLTPLELVLALWFVDIVTRRKYTALLTAKR